MNNSLDAVGLSSSRRKGTSHYRVVGMENSTGKFLSGENVPTGMRPTVFWEHQQISPKFDYNTNIEKKDLRIASHKKNLENY